MGIVNEVCACGSRRINFDGDRSATAVIGIFKLRVINCSVYRYKEIFQPERNIPTIV